MALNSRQLKWLSVLFFIICSRSGLAQTNTTYEWNIGAYYGPLMSADTPAVYDIVSMNGVKIAKGLSYYRPEFFYHQGQSDGDDGNKIEYQLYGLTFKNFISVEGTEDVRPFVLTGLQQSQYKTDWLGDSGGGGFHLGFGFELSIAKELHIRNDYIICNGPGRFVVVSIGLQYSFGGATGSESK